MTLVKFNPTRSANLKPWFTDVFDLFNENYSSEKNGYKVPAVNISESDTAFHLELAAPGFKKEDFKINLEKNVLQISSEKKTESESSDKKYTRREYSYAAFSRSFTLPDTADAENISASYEDGVLRVNIAKNVETSNPSREIAIA